MNSDWFLLSLQVMAKRLHAREGLSVVMRGEDRGRETETWADQAHEVTLDRLFVVSVNYLRSVEGWLRAR